MFVWEQYPEMFTRAREVLDALRPAMLFNSGTTNSRSRVEYTFVTTPARAANMSRIRSTGNQTTELRVIEGMRRRGLVGWRRHPRNIPGTPDFYFRNARLVVFVDGCFWHACPKCGHVPKSNVEYWAKKIDNNRRRDARVRRKLRAAGYRTIRLWEHDLRDDRWLSRLERRLKQLSQRAQR